jgi:hypothetical protein
MKPEHSSTCSQKPTSVPYLVLTLHSVSLRLILISPFHLCTDLPSGFFQWHILTKIFNASHTSIMCAACQTHHVFLEVTIQTVLGNEYRVWNFLQSFVTWSLLGPNTLLSTLFSNALIINERQSSTSAQDNTKSSKAFNQKAPSNSWDSATWWTIRLQSRKIHSTCSHFPGKYQVPVLVLGPRRMLGYATAFPIHHLSCNTTYYFHRFQGEHEIDHSHLI